MKPSLPFSFLLWIILQYLHLTDALISTEKITNRRDAIQSVLKTGSSTSILLPLLISSPALADPTVPTQLSNNNLSNVSNALANKLAKRDAASLKNSVFNIPPSAQTFPDFMRGHWKIQSKFRGFLFPSTNIPKTKITSNALIPGFQKCSIASICDVGKEFTEYEMKIDPQTGLEDRLFNFAQVIDANLGYKAVDSVIYDGKQNPNRVSINFVKNRTRNAERIELFYNAREAQLIQNAATDKNTNVDSPVFVCSEYMRQVTFSLSQEFGVARQVNGNFAHFWTWRPQMDSNGNKVLKGNVLTAAYLDPQDPLFLEEPTKPVVVYSQDLLGTQIA